MRLSDLEEAVRSIVRRAPKEPALATLAGDGQQTALLPQEFEDAARSLLERLDKSVSRGNKEHMAESPWF